MRELLHQVCDFMYCMKSYATIMFVSHFRILVGLLYAFIVYLSHNVQETRGHFPTYFYLLILASYAIHQVRILIVIMKTCPCNIQRFFSPVKIENFIGFFKIFFLFLLKT